MLNLAAAKRSSRNSATLKNTKILQAPMIFIIAMISDDGSATQQPAPWNESPSSHGYSGLARRKLKTTTMSMTKKKHPPILKSLMSMVYHNTLNIKTILSTFQPHPSPHTTHTPPNRIKSIVPHNLPNHHHHHHLLCNAITNIIISNINPKAPSQPQAHPPLPPPHQHGMAGKPDVSAAPLLITTTTNRQPIT